MPVLKHAKKKLRQDKVRTVRNKKLKELFKKLVKEARAKKTKEAVSVAFSTIDKAAKHHLLHKNKAARMKASLSKLIGDKATVKKEEKAPTTKKTKGTAKKKTSSSKK